PQAVRVHEVGGPEVLRVEEIDQQQPGRNDLLVDVAAAGVNYIDTYHRSGLYPLDTPFGLGLEGAGTVSAVGAGVSNHRPGDRVAWAAAPGSYATQVVVPATHAVTVPQGVSAQVAAALMLQGMTAHYLIASTYPVAQGDWVLVHAGAGGVGLLLIQLATARGGKVIATASTTEKRSLCTAAGAVDALDYPGFADRVHELTGGEGVAVVYDGVGASTFDASLASSRIRGTVVLFGAASGPVPPLDLQRLNSSGSLFVTRPMLAHYTRDHAELTWRAGELFDAVRSGALDVRIGQRYPLQDARQAHEDLEARRTTGKLLLLPRA
ncbi:MAG: quinone oxidoreductase family protein, partial [Sciscionella sp.]